MDWYFAVLRQYAVFSGRARRREYWYFALFNLIAMLLLSFLDILTGLYHVDSGFGLISGLYTLAVLIPSIAVTIRRLHDTGRSGWWLLIALVPLIGAVVLLVFTLLDSQPGANRFGPDPKGMDAEALF